MSAIPHPPRHAIARAVARIRAELADQVDASVWSMDPDETRDTLVRLTELEAGIAELQVRVAAHAQAIAIESDSGATSTANWWAHTCRLARPDAHRRTRLAAALADQTHQPLRHALAAGEVAVEQARVILHALDELPTDLDPELVAKAQLYLVEQASLLDPKALRVIGQRLMTESPVRSQPTPRS